jgi:hypothetical protein
MSYPKRTPNEPKPAEVRHDQDGLTKCRVCSCTETRPCTV